MVSGGVVLQAELRVLISMSATVGTRFCLVSALHHSRLSY